MVLAIFAIVQEVDEVVLHLFSLSTPPSCKYLNSQSVWSIFSLLEMQ